MAGAWANYAELRSSSCLRIARNAENLWISSRVFVKSFFIAKTSYTYTMNYLHQEKSLRDHGVAAAVWRRERGSIPLLPDISGVANGSPAWIGKREMGEGAASPGWPVRWFGPAGFAGSGRPGSLVRAGRVRWFGLAGSLVSVHRRRHGGEPQPGEVSPGFAGRNRLQIDGHSLMLTVIL
jgi:hypothetical protein